MRRLDRHRLDAEHRLADQPDPATAGGLFLLRPDAMARPLAAAHADPADLTVCWLYGVRVLAMTWRRTSPCSDTGVAEDAAGRETRFILWVILGLNWAVAAAKLGYGLLTGAVSMQADGIHSSFDGMSNVIGLIGLWVAAHPPDARYPYGHQKYETFAAAGIGLLLFGTCLYILYSSYLHWRESVVPEVTGLSFGIMLGTMAVNWGVMTWEHRRGKILQSEILVADSLHTASDILSSLAVLIGLAAVAAGHPLLDPIAGVVIAGFIGRTGLLVLREATASRADRARR